MDMPHIYSVKKVKHCRLRTKNQECSLKPIICYSNNEFFPELCPLEIDYRGVPEWSELCWKCGYPLEVGQDGAPFCFNCGRNREK